MAWHPFRHPGLKLISLTLAVLLWLTVNGHQIERRIRVPLSYSNMPGGIEMTGDQLDDVNVNIRGTDGLVSSLSPGQLRVIIDLGNSHPGVNMIPLRVDEVVAPPGIEVLQVDPGHVNITLERSGKTEAPVHPTIDGQLPRGYAVDRVDVRPATVTVLGPESRLAAPITVQTERVLLDGHTTTFSQDVNVGVADAELRLPAAQTVRVTVHVRPDRADQ
jgi:YbbR domain-containing protein